MAADKHVKLSVGLFHMSAEAGSLMFIIHACMAFSPRFSEMRTILIEIADKLL